MPLAGLELYLAPAIDWKSTFEKMDYKGVDTVIVGQPEYYRALNKALTTFTALTIGRTTCVKTWFRPTRTI